MDPNGKNNAKRRPASHEHISTAYSIDLQTGALKQPKPKTIDAQFRDALFTPEFKIVVGTLAQICNPQNAVKQVMDSYKDALVYATDLLDDIKGYETPENAGRFRQYCAELLGAYGPGQIEFDYLQTKHTMVVDCLKGIEKLLADKNEDKCGIDDAEKQKKLADLREKRQRGVKEVEGCIKFNKTNPKFIMDMLSQIKDAYSKGGIEGTMDLAEAFYLPFSDERRVSGAAKRDYFRIMAKMRKDGASEDAMNAHSCDARGMMGNYLYLAYLKTGADLPVVDIVLKTSMDIMAKGYDLRIFTAGDLAAKTIRDKEGKVLEMSISRIRGKRMLFDSVHREEEDNSFPHVRAWVWSGQWYKEMFECNEKKEYTPLESLFSTQWYKERLKEIKKRRMKFLLSGRWLAEIFGSGYNGQVEKCS